MKRSTRIVLTAFIACTIVFLFRRPHVSHNSGTPAETIIVGTSADFQPLSFKEDGEIVGFDIDVMKEISKRLAQPIIIVDMPFGMLLPQLQLGKIHVIAAGMTPTPERAQQVSFTKAHLEGSPLVIMQLASVERITAPQELAGKNVIVNSGYTSDQYVSQIKNVHLCKLPTVADAIMALRSQRADAFVTSLSSIQPFMKTDMGKEFVITPIASTGETTALGVSPQHPQLLNRIQTILDDMEKDGTLTSLKNKWLKE